MWMMAISISKHSPQSFLPKCRLLVAVPTKYCLVLLLLLWFLLSPCLFQSLRLFLPLKKAPVSQGDLSPAVPTVSSPWSPRALRMWNQWPLPWLCTKTSSSPEPPKMFCWGPPSHNVCLSLTYTVSSVSGPLPLTKRMKTKYKALNEEGMPYITCAFPYSLFHKYVPLPHVFKYTYQKLANATYIRMYIRSGWTGISTTSDG